MQPAVPEPPHDQWYAPGAANGFAADGVSADDIGAFEQGNQLSRWALSRYIVGRVILERVSWALLGLAVALLVLGGLAEWGVHSTALVVLAVILALSVLLMRATLRAILRRLMAFEQFAPVEAQVRRIIRAARKDIFAELGRVGLPSHSITLPLLLPRLLGRRRRDTMARIRQFEVERAVSRAHRDELYLALHRPTGATGRYGAPT